MLRSAFAGLDRVGAMMLERGRQMGSGPARTRAGLRPLPTCEFDYEYYGQLAARVRHGF